LTHEDGGFGFDGIKLTANRAFECISAEETDLPKALAGMSKQRR
jgi:hypothetical protein